LSGIFDSRHGKVGTRLEKSELPNPRNVGDCDCIQIEFPYDRPAGVVRLEYPDSGVYAGNDLQKEYREIESNAAASTDARY
jgi:hypothetical protein